MKTGQCHEICFRNTENDWDNALPVGNGRLGAMVFFQDNTLHVSLNHYDCYYRLLPRPHGQAPESGSEKEKSSGMFQDPARFYCTYQELCSRVDTLRKNNDTQAMHYSRMLHPPSEMKRPSYKGASYPPGAELLLPLNKKFETGGFCLKLLIEEAKIVFEAEKGGDKVKAEIIAARKPDGILLHLSQTADGLWMQEKWMNGSRPDNARALAKPDTLSCGSNVNLAVTILPEKACAEKAVRDLLSNTSKILGEHRAYWKEFWCSKVRLPDTFLEHLWYMQLYLLDCSSAKGSSYPEQSWGLSGLWDIRKPNMWGSMWYWDVNIQSSFWGTYMAGHPEFLKLFCDGYLAYEQDIRQYTRQVYGFEGWALDYPHTLYHCIQPWCAQFLWLYWLYTGDIIFLEQKAYPVFREQIAFYQRLAQKDTEGILHIYYDISPEQGPVTSDSVITTACIRKLLRIAIKAAETLKRPGQEREEYENIFKCLPPYPRTVRQNRYKDSLLAQDNLFLRHPSLLMPLFPGEEPEVLRKYKDGHLTEEYLRWKETLQYAAAHTETGTFGMGWLAAAAAKLGLGKDALMLLYERGLDYVLHNNGLAYEESPRFLNYCHLTKPAHYLPVMMEAAGGILNAVNLMLLQTSDEGEIHVFPAVPKGSGEISLEKIQYQHDRKAVRDSYGDWADISFDGLLTPGGFRVSARQKNFQTVFLKIESTRDALLKLRLPEELSPDGQCLKVEQFMQAGSVLCFGEDSDHAPAPETVLSDIPCKNGITREAGAVPCHLAAFTRRRLFLGANAHTRYYQAIDAFTCPYLFGNELRYTQTPCIFDFGADSRKISAAKDYKNAYPMQTIFSGQCLLYCAGPRPAGMEKFSSEKGYGFLETGHIQAIQQDGPDDFCRDFLEGTETAVFALHLPKGKYDLLIVSGNEETESYSGFRLTKQGTAADTGILPPGHYGCTLLPLIQKRDGEILLEISSLPGYCWKLNALFVNKEYGF